MSITFNIERIENGLAYGTLSWPDKGLRTGAFSGPYGRNELPAGLYHCYRNKLLDKPNEEPYQYCDSLRKCWMQAIDPQFSTHRNNLGIHPDGNKLGTFGCIGLLESDTSAWYDAFYVVPRGEYTALEVFV